jgi:DNA-binding CsgD family transcriptional regulator
LSILRGLPTVMTKTSSVRHTNISIADAISAPGRPLKSTTDAQTYDLLMAGLEALDLVSVGLAVTNAHGNLLLANRTAEHLFESRDGLEVTARKTIRTSRRGGPVLEDLIRQAARSTTEGTADSILAIPRSSGKRPLTLLIRSVDVSSGNRDALAPAALLFILDPEVPIGTAETELRQLYGLTSTEACLASLLMEGKTLDDCCRLLDIRRSTARTHLQHLFEKVGVQRQSDLVSLLLKSIGLVRIGRNLPKARASVANSEAGNLE